MIKLETIYFGNINTRKCTQFPLTMFEQIHLKYCVTLTLQGTMIEPQCWYIRSDDLHELYIESRRMVRQFIKQPCIDAAVLIFSHPVKNHSQWLYYRPMVITN